jgi:RNA polymerase sigma factor (sigma-70 family)
VTPWALINPARLAGSGLLRTQTDARLVDLVRAGNDTAFEAIVLRYRRSLLGHCRRLLPAARAEDAVQQTLLRALEAMRADRRELELGPWLHRIAHNTAVDSLRRFDSHWEELDEGVDGVEPTHAAAERHARFRSVVSSMGELPARQRRALVLRELEGRSYDEIAADLGVTGAVVRGLLNRARNTMRAGASALVPTAIVARLVGSQPAVRAVELADPPGTSALVAKATAAAAGMVAVVAMNGSPGSDRARVPHAEAAVRPPALETDGGRRSARDTGAATMDLGVRRPRATRPAVGAPGDGPAAVRRASSRTTAGGGDRTTAGGGDRATGERLGGARPLGGRTGWSRGERGGAAPPSATPLPAGGDDTERDADDLSGGDDRSDDGVMAAAAAAPGDDGPADDAQAAGHPPPDDGADDGADDDGDAPAPAALQVTASPETVAEDDDDEDGAGD